MQSSKSHDATSAMIYGLLFIFLINLIIVVHGVIRGNILIDLPEGFDFFQEAWWIIQATLPFHGLFSLIKYLITFI